MGKVMTTDEVKGLLDDKGAQIEGKPAHVYLMGKGVKINGKSFPEWYVENYFEENTYLDHKPPKAMEAILLGGEKYSDLLSKVNNISPGSASNPEPYTIGDNIENFGRTKFYSKLVVEVKKALNAEVKKHQAFEKAKGMKKKIDRYKPNKLRNSVEGTERSPLISGSSHA